MRAEYHSITRIYQEKLGKPWEENSDLQEKVKVQILYFFDDAYPSWQHNEGRRKLAGDYKVFK